MPAGEAPPGVKDADLRSTTRALLDAPDLRAGRADRFFGQIRLIAEIRAQGGWQNEGLSALSVFVHTPYPRAAANLLSGRPVADLDATNEPILGRLFLMNQDASQGFFVTLSYETPGELLEWLSAQTFGREPTVIVYREAKVIIERMNGAAAEVTRKETIRDQPPAATQEQLIQGLDQFHQQDLITPIICPKGVWLKGAASKYYADKDPERSIQGAMRTFLNAWFRRAVLAECEDNTRAGRIDVRLLIPAVDTGLAYWAVVELKVVKTFVYTANPRVKPNTVAPSQNAEAIAEGLRQAHEFADERDCEPGYLEVFDLRKDKGDDLMMHAIVLTQLKELDPAPVVNVRAVFGSATDARKAGALN